jgi:hypothetical protein
VCRSEAGRTTRVDGEVGEAAERDGDSVDVVLVVAALVLEDLGIDTSTVEPSNSR